MSSPLPRRVRGWWHYSHLVYWHVAALTIATVCGVGTCYTITAQPDRQPRPCLALIRNRWRWRKADQSS